MGVASYRELARTFETELGGNPVAKRTWAVTLSDDTLQGNPPNEIDILSTIGLDNWGQQHSDSLTAFKLRKVSITERYSDSPYHVLVVADYGLVSANELLNPTARAAEWTFESKPSQVAALYYYDDEDVRHPLTNSAYDYYEGLTTDEQLVHATMKKNYSNFPTAQMAATNSVNQAPYFGCATHSWKVAGVNTTYTMELYNNVQHNYWATQCELIYRQSGWNLQLPDVGWNFIGNGQKRRAMVFDFENGEWIASPNPVALDGEGAQTAGAPAILERRVCPEADFSGLFGTPPS